MSPREYGGLQEIDGFLLESAMTDWGPCRLYLRPSDPASYARQAVTVPPPTCDFTVQSSPESQPEGSS